MNCPRNVLTDVQCAAPSELWYSPASVAANKCVPEDGSTAIEYGWPARPASDSFHDDPVVVVLKRKVEFPVKLACSAAAVGKSTDTVDPATEAFPAASMAIP